MSKEIDEVLAFYKTEEGIEELNKGLNVLTWVLLSDEDVAKGWRCNIAKILSKELLRSETSPSVPETKPVISVTKAAALDIPTEERVRIIKKVEEELGVKIPLARYNDILAWNNFSEKHVRRYSRRFPKADNVTAGVDRLSIIKKVEEEEDIIFYVDEKEVIMRWKDFSEDRVKRYAQKCVELDAKKAAERTSEKELPIATAAPPEIPEKKTEDSEKTEVVKETVAVTNTEPTEQPLNRRERRARGVKKAQEREWGKTNVGEVLRKAGADTLALS